MKMKIITVFLMCFVMINITACNGKSNEMERRREEQGSDTQLSGTVKDAFINAVTETDNETN